MAIDGLPDFSNLRRKPLTGSPEEIAKKALGSKILKAYQRAGGPPEERCKQPEEPSEISNSLALQKITDTFTAAAKKLEIAEDTWNSRRKKEIMGTGFVSKGVLPKKPE